MTNRTSRNSNISAIKKNKGENVPKVCPDCGENICVQIKGEPIYVCPKCGKYFGTVPFRLKEEEENLFYKSINEATEREINNYLLSEEQHFPDFLESVVKEIYSFVLDLYIIWLSLKKGNNESVHREFQTKNNPYCDNIIVYLTGLKNNDISDDELYSGNYVSDGFDKTTKKLQRVIVRFSIPINEIGSTSKERIMYIISHEVEHMFDDWKEQCEGRESVNNSPRSLANGNLYRILRNSSVELERAIGYAGYLSYFSEEKAFATEAYYELKTYGCTDKNYNEILKKCQGFRYYSSFEKSIIPAIKRATKDALYDLNETLNDKNFIYSNIPKVKFSDNMEFYREKLINWAILVSRKFFKKFYGIVGLFVMDFKKRNPRMLPVSMSFEDYINGAKS